MTVLLTAHNIPNIKKPGQSRWSVTGSFASFASDIGVSVVSTWSSPSQAVFASRPDDLVSIS
jgi:hypothetical protein